MILRRSFFVGMLAAPAIVRVDSLMVLRGVPLSTRYSMEEMERMGRWLQVVKSKSEIAAETAGTLSESFKSAYIKSASEFAARLSESTIINRLPGLRRA